MWNLEKHVPSTDGMSCTVNIKTFQMWMFGNFEQCFSNLVLKNYLILQSFN